MSSEVSSIAQSQLDLYDFFSVLLPGAYFLITLIPVVPTSLPFGTASTAAVLLVGGYVVGRALHTAAESYDKIFNVPSNRETFINAITDEDIDILSDEMIDRFYGTAKADSGLAMPYDRRTAGDKDLSALYVYVRSQLYQHGNVRSQSFQAIYAFYRSTYLATQLAVGCYLIYAIGQAVGYWSGVGGYSTYIGGLDIQAGTILLSAEVLFVIGMLTLHDAKEDYRKYYIEYLIVDYLSK
ncbi:hypothetical protein [Halohasta salina]|uniref:hypothetical protein n=1 Tax=Halohasta salina TaxID=2961621 RepID=UPI0020A2503B|nr:hypothetical protein [Halohasta salina]